jgi:hypothetical protein
VGALVRFDDALAVVERDSGVICPVEKEDGAVQVLDVVDRWILVSDELRAVGGKVRKKEERGGRDGRRKSRGGKEDRLTRSGRRME